MARHVSIGAPGVYGSEIITAPSGRVFYTHVGLYDTPTR